MPLFKQNVNDDFDKMLWYMIQTKLAEESQERYQENLREQFRQSEIYDVAKSKRDVEVAEKKAEVSIKETIRKALIDAQENPEYERLRIMANLAETEGRIDEANALKGKMMEIASPIIDEYMTALEGGTQTKEKLVTALRGLGPDGLQKIIEEASKGRQRTMTEKLAKEAGGRAERELNLREKKGIENVPPGEPGEGEPDQGKYAKIWKPTIDDAIEDVSSQIKDLETQVGKMKTYEGKTKEAQEAQKAMEAKKVPLQNKLKKLKERKTALRKLLVKINKAGLTPEEEDLIYKDVEEEEPSAQSMPTTGQNIQTLPPISTALREETIKVLMEKYKWPRAVAEKAFDDVVGQVRR